MSDIYPKVFLSRGKQVMLFTRPARETRRARRRRMERENPRWRTVFALMRNGPLGRTSLLRALAMAR